MFEELLSKLRRRRRCCCRLFCCCHRSPLTKTLTLLFTQSRLFTAAIWIFVAAGELMTALEYIFYSVISPGNFCNVIYCKLGYFRWGKISRKCWQDISRGGNFHDTAPFSFIKAYGFYLRVGVIFAKKTKTQKLPPRENFHVYSTEQKKKSIHSVHIPIVYVQLYEN